MKYDPIDRMKARLESSKDSSDSGYFFDLLLYGELVTKIISLCMVAAVNEDTERSQYRLKHKLVRANAIGDFSKIIEETVIGPPAQLLSSSIREYEQKDLTQRASGNDWQYQAQKLLIECLDTFNIPHDKLPHKSPLRNWFQNFTVLRNKTKGHGAPVISSCAVASPKLRRAIDLIVNNFSTFNRSWAYLHRNLSARYRVSYLNGIKDFEHLKQEKHHSYDNGIYIFIDHPRKVDLIYSNAELTDYWLTNGNLKNNKFETISYVSDERKDENADAFQQPITKLPNSHTGGKNDLEAIGNCFTNIPEPPDFYIKRLELEGDLKSILNHIDRFPMITLLGKGGVGKTSLALNVISELTKSNRFDLIIWFSARDIDLLIEGPKQVQTSVLNSKDIAKEYCSLVYSDEKIEDQVQKFSDDLTQNPLGTALYVFDNFETISNPVDVFEWINTHVRNPNKVLITSRISRNFKADYPIEIQGMSDDECHELIEATAAKLGIRDLLTSKYIQELISESDGHPYIIKILLGEVAKTKQIHKIQRIVAEQEKILSALFKRTFNSLSPVAKRVFLTLSSWNSMVSMIALEAVLWRPENEKMNVQDAIEELRTSSFIDVISRKEDEIINVPLSATIFGKSELEVYPEKFKILADRALLMEFGTTTYSNISSGLARIVDKKFKTISQRINSISDLQKDLPTLKYIASKYNKAYFSIIEIFKEYEDYESVKYYLREYLKNDMSLYEKTTLWQRLADTCKFTKDWEGESHALIELIQLPSTNLKNISDTANRFNHHLFHDQAAKKDEYRTVILTTIIEKFKQNIDNATATDYSRLGWLLLNNGEPDEAQKHALEGLKIEPGNVYCQKLEKRISETNH